MIAAWLLALSTVDPSYALSTADPVFSDLICPGTAGLRSIDPATEGLPAGQSIRHVFQNGHAEPVKLFWVDRRGELVDKGDIAPGRFLSLQTHPGHVFLLMGANDRCRDVVRIDGVLTGTYLGTSRYRRAPIDGWAVFVDRALDPADAPAQAAFAALDRVLREAQGVLPPAALARERNTPIFLHDRSGPGAMFHTDPEWLVAHGRTVELTDAIEISDARMFVETLRIAPAALLHEFAHAYYAKLPDADRATVDAAYRDAIAHGLYRSVKRHDGTLGPAYASGSAVEYFAELSEAYFGRNDFVPFTRTELATYDPVGFAVVARLWR